MNFTSVLNTPRRVHIAAFAFFLMIALIITWPLLTVLTTHFPGYDFGDAHEMTRHIWWFKYAAQHGQPLLFQPLLGYPDGMEGVILWSDPLQFFPGWLLAFFLPLPAAYNLQSLLNLALNGWAAYFLVWKLTNQRYPALLAGVVFMAAPTLQGHLAGGHGGLLVQWPLPLFAYTLLHLREVTHPLAASINRSSRIARIAPLITLFFLLLPFGHTLQLIYAAMPLLAVFGLTLLLERNWRALLVMILSVGAGFVILVIFLIPVIQATFGTSAYTGEGGGVTYSIDFLSIITPSFNHPLFGQLDYTHRVLGINIVEGSSYIGIVAGLLAIVAVWKWRTARWWLLLGAVAWVLSLGPLLKIFDQPITLQSAEYSTFITLPWALVADLPGLNLARTPGRFNFLLALAVAVLAGYGAVWLWDKIGHSRILARTHRAVFLTSLTFAVLIALVLFDYQSFWPMPTYSAEVPQAIQAISTRQEVRAVFDMPWDNLLAAKDALWLQTAHEKPIIAGQVTRRTPVSPAKLTILEGTLDPALLDAAGVDVVILHKNYDYDGSLRLLGGEKLGEPFYEDARLALWDAPEAEAAPVYTEWIATSPETSNRADLYLYLPEAGWLDMDANLIVQNGQSVSLLLNDQRLTHLNAGVDMHVALPFIQPGYQVVSLVLDNPCPVNLPGDLTCNGLSLNAVQFGNFQPSTFDKSVQFDHGLNLQGALVTASTAEAYSVKVNLWWQFDEPRTDQDIRFIKILDSDGNQLAGRDETLGAFPVHSGQGESITFALAEAAPGEYQVYVGWYSYPDLVRFPVLTDVPGAGDGLALIGEFAIDRDG